MWPSVRSQHATECGDLLGLKVEEWTMGSAQSAVERASISESIHRDDDGQGVQCVFGFFGERESERFLCSISKFVDFQRV